MKAKDLMIGDWYAFRGHPYKCTSSDIASLAECEEIGAPTDISEIPLTPEILEKNGFVKYDMNSEEDYLDVPDLSPRFAYGYFPNGIENGWVINIINHYLVVSNRGCSIHKKIYFVHELQHALRFCGIEKEIVL